MSDPVAPNQPSPSSGGVLQDLRSRVHQEVTKVVVGQEEALDTLLVALAVGGHALLEGVPGTAKTLLASTFSRALGLEFRRAQFTPDLLPSDLTGNMTLRDRELVFRPGPVFTNVLLADEINRTPPKTQAALLEAMEERQVSVDGEPRPLGRSNDGLLLIEVAVGNEAARALYDAAGFEAVGRRPAYYAGREDALIMRRRLRSLGDADCMT